MITRYDEFRRIRIDMMNALDASDNVWEYNITKICRGAMNNGSTNKKMSS